MISEFDLSFSIPQIFAAVCILSAIVYFTWLWKSLRFLILFSALAVFIKIYFLHQYFAPSLLLKYLLSSRFLIVWMIVLIVLSTIFYWVGFLSKARSLTSIASQFSWYSVFCGIVGMASRWHDSYSISIDFGQIPFSNLYEVSILFCLIVVVLVLYYDEHYAIYAINAFALFVVTLMVLFLAWYSIVYGSYEIQPLMPVLQSFWMHIHVPSNFIGYSCFVLSAMFGIGYLLREKGYWIDRLPNLDILDLLMYRMATIGFTFLL